MINGGEANEDEMQAFLTGLGIDKAYYSFLDPEIRKINLLNMLDKCRWAIDAKINNLEDYIHKVKDTYLFTSCGKE